MTTTRPGLRSPSLHARFILGVTTMLLPPTLLAILGVVAMEDMNGRFTRITEEVALEMQPIARLQALMLRTDMVLDDIIERGDASGRGRFVRQERQVDREFGSISPGPFDHPAEVRAVQAAREQWDVAMSLAASLLARDPAHSASDMAATRARIAERIAGAVDSLDEVYRLAEREIALELASARETQGRAKVVMAGLLVAVLVIAVLGSLQLMRALFPPLSALRRAADRFAGGDLAHRVEHAHMPGELQRLARAFNAMATKLEESRAELETLASRDGLTGLFNHRTFYALLASELERSRRFGHPLSLLLIDIDHFKRVNDAFGHQAGDAVLKALGELLVRETRAVDRVARYGGEELAVLLPETGAAVASAVGERIRALVQACAFASGNGSAIALTVSVGVASFPAHAGDERSLVAAADAALYAGKQSGRNRVVLAGEVAP